mmetsp:Transcript_2998/g.5530  ORF Transcript_2998/g.5530 Transcript_2998/m.5530 type:complete len:99 (-) Transcript_2998:163-459(-)
MLWVRTVLESSEVQERTSHQNVLLLYPVQALPFLQSVKRQTMSNGKWKQKTLPAMCKQKLVLLSLKAVVANLTVLHDTISEEIPIEGNAVSISWEEDD